MLPKIIFNSLLLLCVACFALVPAFAQKSMNGQYVGLEEMCRVENGKKECYIDPARPKRKWYHLTRIRIKGDSAWFAQNPISVYKKDTLYSASDGGFYYYRGTVIKTDSTVVLDLKEDHCDYCAVPVEIKPDGTRGIKKRTLKYTGRLKAGGFVINGYLFQPSKEEDSPAGQ